MKIISAHRRLRDFYAKNYGPKWFTPQLIEIWIGPPHKIPCYRVGMVVWQIDSALCSQKRTHYEPADGNLDPSGAFKAPLGPLVQ